MMSFDIYAAALIYINDLLKVFRTLFNYPEVEGHIKTKPAAQAGNMKQLKL